MKNVQRIIYRKQIYGKLRSELLALCDEINDDDVFENLIDYIIKLEAKTKYIN